ncbi:MAG: CotH kinase family protein [Bacteroidaceae bacterium]|nr:CotH kinase family protein [Bacteroidaceae bacterium]
MRRLSFYLTLLLCVAISRVNAGTDLTYVINNPTFDSNANGWTVNMPGAQNKGYQSASYTGSASISHFIETWVAKPKTLGEGSISQTIYGLPAGTYTLEADVIACNQETGASVDGALLFAQCEDLYAVETSTLSGKPQHFTCEFTTSGGDVTIGMRTLASTNANWVAMDNVQLFFYGSSDATQISLSPLLLNIVVGETESVTATVNTSNSWLNRVEWTSDDDAIASVDGDGRVKGMGKGSTYIYATAVASSLTGRIRVKVSDSDPSALIINEIQVANTDMFIDPSVNYGGWVELYNPTDVGISLGGLYVSGDAANLQQFQLPADAGAVPAHGFKNIWFDHHDTGTKYSSEAYKQVDFKLESEGGTIYISDANGQLLASQTYPAAVQRVSYARLNDGTGAWSLTSTPSPEASNAGSTFAAIQLAAPVVDKDATVYSSAFDVQVTIPEGATLRYTTDGSTPTLDNGETSTTGLFHVSLGTKVYRFRLFKDGYLPSPVVTRSYIYKDKDYYLPIVSVVTNAANLYDDEIGVYTVGTNGITGNGISYTSNRNRSWERPVNFEYLITDDDGGSFLMALSQECDFEVCGGWSRNLYSPASSFRLKGNKYNLGQSFLPYSFFEEKPYIKSKSIVVRNGGNDGYARIRDAAIHEIILRSGFYMDCQTYQPAHIFINGQFKFTYNIREPNNKNHGYSNYGIDTDEMDQFEINGSKGYEQKTGDDVVFRRWMTLAQQLADNPTADDIYAEICQLVDIDEYCNYMAAECYVGSSDWITNSNNIKGYRSRTDGKFHLVFMDVDAGFSSTNMLGSLQGKLNDSRYDTGRNFLIDIFLNMLKYEPFKKQFIDAFCLVDGSVFEDGRVTEIITSMKDKTYKAMSFEGLTSNLTSSANGLLSAITQNHSQRMENMRKYFGLATPYTASLSSNIEGGSLLVNGQEVPTGQFKGQLCKPVTLSACAPSGYRFTGWQLSGSDYISDTHTLVGISDMWYYYDQGSLDGTNWKSANYNLSSWRTGYGPFGYGNVGMEGSSDYATTIDYGSNSKQKRPTYYFRRSINLSSEPTDEDVFQLTYYVDDGFVAYVNGVEVGRYLMSGTPSYDTYSTTYVGATAATSTITIDNSLLHMGDNVIAVEVHNTSATSSDIYWAAALVTGHKSKGSLVSTSPDLDLASLNTSAMTLVATYEPLPDDQLISDLAMPVKVNEVSAANTVFVNDAFKKNDWLELYNPTDTDINVAGLYVSDNIDDPLKYQIPSSSIANTIVPAHGHLVLWADKLEAVTQLHVPFKLSNADDQVVFITSSDEFVNNNTAFFQAHPDLVDFADGILYQPHRGDQSVGRFPDGASQLYCMERPTIEQTNSLRTYDALLGSDEGFMDYGRSTLPLDLVKGWNWVSHPFTHSLSVNRFRQHTDRIVGQSLDASYNSQTSSMEGTLRSLTAGQLYKFQMSQDYTYELDGQVPGKPSALALGSGWNWIGYPVLGSQTVSTAFASTDVTDGDIVLGQQGFSVYSTEDGWVGTLSSLVQGHGYLYKTNAPKSLQLRPAASRVRLRRPSAAKAMDSYGVNPHSYPSVMGLIAVVMSESDGSLIQPNSPDVDGDSDIEVLAYAGEECRGHSQWVDGQLFLTLYGDGAEELTFKVITADGTVLDIRETLTFASDVIGTRQSPVILHAYGNTNTGVNHTSSAATQAMPVGYYNLHGIYLGTRADVLHPGLYLIRNSNGTTTKVFINHAAE